MDVLTVLQYEDVLRGFWCEWFNAYPGREVFQDNNRVFLNSSTKFLNYVEDCKRKYAACWMSVQPFRKRDDVSAIEKLFFDFDSENDLRKAWVDAKKFVSATKQYYNAEALLCFSGRKGYHVYVWLANPVEFPSEQQNMAKQFYVTIQNLILKGLKFETLDRQVLGDIKRLSRVPYSTHKKSGFPCVPVTLNHTPLVVSTIAGFKQHGLNNAIVDLCLKRMKRKAKRKRYRYVNVDMKCVRPCIQTALNKDLEQKEGHSIRVAVAAEFLNAGYKPNEVARLFHSQGDYNFEKSLYYVEDIQKRRYKRFKCETIRSLGFCLGDSCIIFKNHRKGE